jgi:hypothetical protein
VVNATDTEIDVAGLTVETAPTNALVQLAGIRPELGDLALTVSGITATLTSGNNGATNNIDFTTLGLTVGQRIHIGGLTGANQFSAGAGYARITAIAASQLDLDKLSSTLATDPGAGETVDLLFGMFIRNVDVDSGEYLERTFQFEAGYDNLENPGGATEYEYSIGNYADSIELEMALTDKIIATFGFIGQDTEVPTITRKTGAASGISPVDTTALNTTNSFVDLVLEKQDGTDLSACFKEITLGISNNVSPEKCIGTLGASFVNTGIFEVSIEGQMLFTEGEVKSVIRNNETVTAHWVLKNDEGALAFDVPSMTLGGGDLEFPINESILINLEGLAFKDETLLTSFSVSTFPIVP